MMKDIGSIEFNEIFSDLSLSSILNSEESYYISEKFHDYLYKESMREIEPKQYINFKPFIRYEVDNRNYTNAEWSVIKLIDAKDERINNAIKKSRTYTDLYELILELIYNEHK